MKPALQVVPEAPAAVSPLLRWAGGKRWFVKEFGDDMFTHVLERGGYYIEPFLGGGAMALHLGLSNMVLGDVEEELIMTCLAIRDQPEELATFLGLLGKIGTDEKNFYYVREQKPHSPIEVAARCIYLNKLCFNGIYRKNKKGEFNVPYGKTQKPMPTLDQINEVSKALANAELHCGDAVELIECAGENDVLYVDPPYHGTFSNYTARGFDDADHQRLAKALYDARERGAEFYAHNADTPEVRAWYGDWAEILPMEERRGVNAKGEGRGKVPCVLIAGVK